MINRSQIYAVFMRILRRLAVYSLITLAIEGFCIIVLYTNGYPYNLSEQAEWAENIALNFVLWMEFSYAIGGPSPGKTGGNWFFSPVGQLVGGTVGMFAIVTAIGESTYWLRKRISEETGHDEQGKFTRQLESAVREFTEATYSPARVQAAYETKLYQLYTQHPEQTMNYLKVVLRRVEQSGTTKTKERLRTLIKEFEEKTAKQQ